jgi:hypothetical protein
MTRSIKPRLIRENRKKTLISIYLCLRMIALTYHVRYYVDSALYVVLRRKHTVLFLILLFLLDT